MPVLYLIACGAPPAAELAPFVRDLQDDGWTVCVIATPMAERFMDLAELVDLTGFPVRIEHRQPGEADVFPPASAIAVAPASFNTINKWALGISDTLALGVLHELMGAGLPIVAGVWAKEPLRKHPAFAPHVSLLQQAGVQFLEHGSGATGFSWPKLRDALAATRLQ